MFFNVIKLQNNGYAELSAHKLIAQRNSLSLIQMKRITTEGSMCNWPKP